MFQPTPAPPPAGQHHRYRLGKRHGPFFKALAGAGRGGLTDAELSGVTGQGQTQSRGRRQELLLLGYVEDSGTTRKTHSGRAATVWRLTKAGVKKAQQIERDGDD